MLNFIKKLLEFCEHFKRFVGVVYYNQKESEVVV